MSDTSHSQNSKPMPEHGTTKAYVVGFIISLIFTFIPYYLVVHHNFSGSVLLATILGFAVLQMIIQVTFFLHLGRGPKPKWNLFFFISTVGIILVVVGGSIMIINNLHYNMSPGDQLQKLVGDEAIYQIGGAKTGACQGQHHNHKATIKNGRVNPAHTLASKCDTLTFINEDSNPRSIAFGAYPQHKAYAGEIDLSLPKGYSQTITLSEPGSFKFYDRQHTQSSGDFNVSPR
ncbi:MAG TPA: cytochrome o ubiquinol oxidase subunit IV [Candidatus Saccharimonadales bacterium]|nr:cytochrome o ubiquinol oxidase subunit IV [Candidatus Saccharimonadales bacterium]